jgi:hypothetical protein
MLPKHILGEKVLYAAITVPGAEFVLWTHFRKGKWMIGVSDVVRVWQESFVGQVCCFMDVSFFFIFFALSRRRDTNLTSRTRAFKTIWVTLRTRYD